MTTSHCAHCRGARRARAAGAGSRRSARRWRHRALHRPLPQGSHWRPGRRRAARAGDPADLSARTRRPAPASCVRSRSRAGWIDAIRAALALPPPSRRSRTSTCPSSSSAAPRARWHVKPGSSRWPTSCWPTRRWCRCTPPQAFVVPPAEVVAGRRQAAGFLHPLLVLDGVRDLLSERWADQTELVQRCASGCGPKAGW
jgi:hypothetical protein